MSTSNDTRPGVKTDKAFAELSLLIDGWAARYDIHFLHLVLALKDEPEHTIATCRGCLSCAFYAVLTDLPPRFRHMLEHESGHSKPVTPVM